MTELARHDDQFGPEAAAGVGDSVTSSIVDEVLAAATLRRDVLRRDRDRLVACAVAMAVAFASGGRLFAFGNGGSAVDAHDFASGFLRPGSRGVWNGARPLPAYALSNDAGVVTALAADAGFDAIFSRQLATRARRGDIAVGLSADGDVENVVCALAEARRHGMVTVGLVGATAGRLAELSRVDHLFVVPSTSPHRVTEVHATVYHVLTELTWLTLRDLPTVHRPKWTTR